MKLEEFNSLDETEKQAILETLETSQEDLKTLTAERDSLKEENEAFNSSLEEVKKDLAEAKKLNFTLARQSSRNEQKSFEDIINERYIKKGK